MKKIPNFGYILGLVIQFLSIWMIFRKRMHKAFTFSYFLDLFVDIIMTKLDMIHVHKLD